MNWLCPMQLDVGRNYMMSISESVMSMFATLLKQLQSTQKQMNKLTKKNKDLQNQTINVAASRSGS